MLHSHLPYYRKAGMWPFGEENLYECMLETYLPLLNALTELANEGIKANITVGITPVLAEQLADKHLNDGFDTYVNSLIRKAEADCHRFEHAITTKTHAHAAHRAFVAGFYKEHLNKLKTDFNDTYQRNVLGAFRKLQDEGCIEITTSAATHGFLPLLGNDEAISGQIKAGVATYERWFGRAPRGIWLPECAYRSVDATDPVTGKTTKRLPIEAFLYENNLNYFFTEFSAIEGSKSSETRRDRAHGHNSVYRGLDNVPTHALPDSGLTTNDAYYLEDYPVAVLGRDEKASFQVWSSANGYPGDGVYREFHMKDDVSGLQYWQITSKEADFGEKMLYDPVKALKQAEEHAEHYANTIETMLKDPERNLLMVSFDTELFGHWWFEGVHWLKHVLRHLHQKNQRIQTASDYLESNKPEHAINLPDSTWGAGGHYWVWNNDETNWMWPKIHEAENTMKTLVEQYENSTNTLAVRGLNQAFRELLLLESSDWPFLVTTGQATDYAVERFETHLERFHTIADALKSGTPAVSLEAQLDDIEAIDNAFAHLDYRWYQHTPQAPAPDSLQPA